MTSDKGQLQPWTALVFAICVSILAVGAVVGPIQDFWLWQVVGYGIWGLAGFAMGTVFHELGHAACAAMGSIPVHRIIIGFGPLLWRSRIGDARLEVRVLPLMAGRVGTYAPLDYRGHLWVLFLLGGVVGNLTLICLVAGLRLFGDPGPAPDFLDVVLFTQVVEIAANLIPLPGRCGGTDGMQLLRLLWRPAVDHATIRKIYDAYVGKYGKGKLPLAMTMASSRLLYHVLEFQTDKDKDVHAEAREAILRELGRCDLTREEQMWAFDALTTEGIVSGDPAIRPCLDGWSQQALTLGPDLPTLQGSRGAVLVELGRYAEGKALLAPLAAPDPARAFDAFMSQAFLALAERGLGNEAAARQSADAARATAKAAYSGKTETSPTIAAMLARLDREIPPSN
jgi:hypothetical protein